MICRLVRVRIEERLEDERGGDLVDHLLMLLAGVAGLVKDLVGFAAGEALVPEVDGEAGKGAEFGGKGLDFGCAGAVLAGEMQRVADDDGGNRVPAGKPADGTEIVAGVAAGLEGHDGLGRQAEFIRHSDADALGADVEAEVAGYRH